MSTFWTEDSFGNVDRPCKETEIASSTLTGSAAPPGEASTPGGTTTKADRSEKRTCHPSGTVLTLKPTGWSPVYETSFTCCTELAVSGAAATVPGLVVGIPTCPMPTAAAAATERKAPV